jgi:hypothetical protein
VTFLDLEHYVMPAGSEDVRITAFNRLRKNGILYHLLPKNGGTKNIVILKK